MSKQNRSHITVENNQGKLFVIFYTEDDIKIKGYKYGVFDNDNPEDINSSLFQSTELEECRIFASAPRDQRLVFIYDKEKDAHILNPDEIMSFVNPWRDGKIRIAKFLLSDDKSCEFYMSGDLFGTFHKLFKDEK